MSTENLKARAFLIFCAVGLVPIALGYGAKPSVTLDALFGINVDTTASGPALGSTVYPMIANVA